MSVLYFEYTYTMFHIQFRVVREKYELGTLLKCSIRSTTNVLDYEFRRWRGVFINCMPYLPPPTDHQHHSVFFSNTHYLYPTAAFLYFLRAFSLFIVFAIFLVPIKQKQKKSRISVPFTPFLFSGESRSCAYVDLPRHNVNSLVVANKRFWSLYKSLWRWMG